MIWQDASDQLDALLPALASFQWQQPLVSKDSRNQHGKYNFASIDSVIQAIRERMLAHDLAVSQPIVTLDSGQPALRTVLLHTKTGQYVASLYPLAQAGMKSSANDAQQMGAAITYARRYCLLAILGIATGDDDDTQCISDADRARREAEAAQAEAARQQAEQLKRDLKDRHYALTAMGDDGARIADGIYRRMTKPGPGDTWQQISRHDALMEYDAAIRALSGTITEPEKT